MNTKKRKMSTALWNGFFYFSTIYFFLYFVIFNENTTKFGKHFLNTFYNLHIELFILLILVLRVSAVAKTDECIHRMMWAFILACYTIGCYLEAGKVTRIREVIIFGLIITASQINFDRLVQWILISYLTVAFIKIIGSINGWGTEKGWIKPLLVEKDFGRGGLGIVQTRYQLGFGHPNALHCAFFCIAALVLYLLRNYKIKYAASAITFALNLILYHYTDSRTGMFIVIVVLVFYICFPFIGQIKNKIVQTVIYALLQTLPFAIAIFTLVTGYIGVTSPQMIFINKLLTGRLTFINTVITQTPLTFMGTNLPVTCDSNYVNTLYRCGIFVFIAYMALHVITVHYFYRKKEWTVLAIIAAFDIYYIIEYTMLSMNRNIIPYFMMACSAAYSNHLPENSNSLFCRFFKRNRHSRNG